MRIRTEHWIDGQLEVYEEFLDDYIRAHKRLAELHRHHSHHSDDHVIKMYDEDDCIVHGFNSPDYDNSSYA
jgi:hypothetical protein